MDQIHGFEPGNADADVALWRRAHVRGWFLASRAAIALIILGITTGMFQILANDLMRFVTQRIAFKFF
jgi:hypothetical protein